MSGKKLEAEDLRTRDFERIGCSPATSTLALWCNRALSVPLAESVRCIAACVAPEFGVRALSIPCGADNTRFMEPSFATEVDNGSTGGSVPGEPAGLRATMAENGLRVTA